MPYCPDCGVELAAQAAKCPLCGADAVEALPDEERVSRAASSLSSKGEANRRYTGDGEDVAAEGREKNTLRWEMLSVSVLISAAAVSAVNLLTSGSLNWALYPLFSLAFLWIVISALIELRQLPALGLPLAFSSLPLFLLALDLVDGRIGWAWPVAIPIAILVELSFGLALLASARFSWKPLLSLSAILLAGTLSCLGIDGSLSIALFGQLHLRWSAVVAASVVPIVIFLVYLHFRVPHVARLRRLFHL
ncbi:MAG TPA: DUF6320 domain-containing protein [Rectinemataceae bacterium]|nr:DUF6320 domain-containing protein [Rectinemataceae bacterium]